MNRRILALALLLLPVALQAQQEARQMQPIASHGGTATVSAPRPVMENTDQLNQRVTSDTTDGLVVSITIDGSNVSLDTAAPARVPRRMVRTEPVAGDVVRATAYARGQAVSTIIQPDVVLNASEGGGLVRQAKRQLTLVFASERPVDSISIEAPATSARATLDVSKAYQRICEADKEYRWCTRVQ